MHQATIQSNNINIHPSVKFGKNVNIKCDSIKLGEFCIIGDNVTLVRYNTRFPIRLWSCKNR
jgi:serine acetyltransferase